MDHELRVRRLDLPLSEEKVIDLKSGDRLLIYGTIYTARDAAHKRLIEAIHNNLSLPFDLKDQVIYYTGPTPARPSRVLGSAGPTTSYRMDIYTPKLLELGLKGMIGKGERSKDVVKSIQNYKAVYFTTIGGAGALISKSIKKAKIIAYNDLGPEAIYRMEVEGLPVIVINDIYGNDYYKIVMSSSNYRYTSK